MKKFCVVFGLVEMKYILLILLTLFTGCSNRNLEMEVEKANHEAAVKKELSNKKIAAREKNIKPNEFNRLPFSQYEDYIEELKRQKKRVKYRNVPYERHIIRRCQENKGTSEESAYVMSMMRYFDCLRIQDQQDFMDNARKEFSMTTEDKK